MESSQLESRYENNHKVIYCLAKIDNKIPQQFQEGHFIYQEDQNDGVFVISCSDANSLNEYKLINKQHIYKLAVVPQKGDQILTYRTALSPVLRLGQIKEENDIQFQILFDDNQLLWIQKNWVHKLVQHFN